MAKIKKKREKPVVCSLVIIHNSGMSLLANTVVLYERLRQLNVYCCDTVLKYRQQEAVFSGVSA